MRSSHRTELRSVLPREDIQRLGPPLRSSLLGSSAPKDCLGPRGERKPRGRKGLDLPPSLLGIWGTWEIGNVHVLQTTSVRVLRGHGFC